MNLKNLIFIFSACLLISCETEGNSDAFIKRTTGRYLYNSNEVIEVYYEKNELYLKWHGATKIKPLKVNDNTFFVKEMNEKLQFLHHPTNGLNYIVLVPKMESDTLKYNFRKLASDEKVPNEYLKNNEFDKALEAYLTIQKKDSLDPIIGEGNLNRLGYGYLRKKNYIKSVQIFKINAALYPESSNVYDSLGEAFMKSGDTILAIENYKKSLTLNSGNVRAKRMINQMEKKE